MQPDTYHLMLLTKDKKKFFTHIKNFHCLIEYAKTFKAQMFRVEIQSGDILALKNLVAALCDPEYKCNVTYKENEAIRIFPENDREKVLNNAGKIQQFIINRLLSGKTVSLKELKEKYQNLKITDACLCNHLSAARKKLTKSGQKIEKLAAGTYCVSKRKEE